ncbi:MAG: Uma2 family endonuclease [Chloroflexi bacterium]|nr:Uma2 family endonuclease [Chloroflexota bacterium]
MAVAARVSLEEFLAMEESKPYRELIDGEVVCKAMPNDNHGALVAELLLELGNYLRRTREAVARTEVRHLQRSEGRVFLPDVSVTLRGRAEVDPEVRARGPIEVVPDFAIEVLSPDDAAGRVLERADFYMRSGVRLLWVVDPDTETVTVYRPGAPQELHRAPQSLDASPVLHDFRLDLASLFAALHDEGASAPS